VQWLLAACGFTGIEMVRSHVASRDIVFGVVQRGLMRVPPVVKTFGKAIKSPRTGRLSAFHSALKCQGILCLFPLTRFLLNAANTP
jgi:hypothetical protein